MLWIKLFGSTNWKRGEERIKVKFLTAKKACQCIILMFQDSIK